jgi:RluA family pseudouridine synthase
LIKPPYSIIYEDPNLAALNKDSGIAVGGERWDPEAARLDKLAEQFFSERDGRTQRLYTVHRIDKETSGLVVFAKDPDTHKKLSSAFETRQTEKTYTAVIHGRPAWAEGKTSCDLPLVPDGNKKHLTIIDNYRGKASETFFRLLLSVGNYSIVEARPLSGRTHQIRVHLAALGHPIVCDNLYGKNSRSGNEAGIFLSSFKRNWRGDVLEERPLLSRLGLHAAELVIEGYDFKAPLPRDMGALIGQMEKCAKPSDSAIL